MGWGISKWKNIIYILNYEEYKLSFIQNKINNLKNIQGKKRKKEKILKIYEENSKKKLIKNFVFKDPWNEFNVNKSLSLIHKPEKVNKCLKTFPKPGNSFNPTKKSRKEIVNEVLAFIEYELKMKYDNFLFFRKKQIIKKHGFSNILPLPLKILQWTEESLNKNQNSFNSVNLSILNYFLKKDKNDKDKTNKKNEAFRKLKTNRRKNKHQINSKLGKQLQRKNISEKKKLIIKKHNLESIEKYLEKFKQIESREKKYSNKNRFKFVTGYKHILPFFSLNKEFTGSLKDIQPIGNLVREFSFNIIQRNKLQMYKIREKKNKKPKFKIQYVIGAKKRNIVVKTHFH